MTWILLTIAALVVLAFAAMRIADFLSQFPARRATSTPARRTGRQPRSTRDGKRASHRAGAATQIVRRASQPAGPLPLSRGLSMPRPLWDLSRIRLARRATPSVTARAAAAATDS